MSIPREYRSDFGLPAGSPDPRAPIAPPRRPIDLGPLPLRPQPPKRRRVLDGLRERTVEPPKGVD